MSGARPKVMLIGGPDVDSRIDLMRALSRDFEVIAVGSLDSIGSAFHEAGFEYASYRMTRRLSPSADLRSLLQLVGLIRRHRPDVVHALDTKPCVLARIAAKVARVPVVLGSVNGLGSLYSEGGVRTSTLRYVYEKVQKLACSLSDATIFQNAENADVFITKGIERSQKAIMIPGSGVRTDLFSPEAAPENETAQVRADLGVGPTNPLVTMVARIVRSKGVREFAAAAELVARKRPECRFVLVGDTDDGSIDRLDPDELDALRPYVTLTGARDDMPDLIGATDVFVLPSYREGIPRVLLEAASMARPIITTDTPGCRDVVVEGTNGYLVPPRDHEALAVKIIELVDDPELRARFGRMSREMAIARFDVSVIAGRICEVYHDLLRSKADGPLRANA